jgi:hypothetical protein
MRAIFLLIVLGAAGYLGYNFYVDKQSGDSAGGESAFPEMAEVATTTPGAVPTNPAVAPVAYKSRIELPQITAPGEKRVAPPGVFYMLDRVSVETRDGVVAVVPGDKVKLLQRKPNRLKLTTGTFDFEAPLDKVTNDIDIALEAERKEAMRLAQRR